MNRLFAELLEKETPKANPEIMNGLAVTHLANAEEYLDRVFRLTSKSFPAGVVYVGYDRCTPLEEYNEMTKARNNKRSYELARADIYLVKYMFTYNGEYIHPRHIYLPFVGDGGIIHISGSPYNIIPVLSDKVISPCIDNVFVRFLRDKIIFKRCDHTIIADGVRLKVQVLWSQIYRKQTSNSKVMATTKALTTIAHYLFAKHGFDETFRLYCGFVPIVGEEDINTSVYPEDKWIIYESTQIQPKGYIDGFYQPTNIRIAIPREKSSVLSLALISGFYYIVDNFPNRFKPTYVNKTHLWMILLGHIIFSGNYGDNKLYSQIEEHFKSLNDYTDEIVLEKLAESGYNVSNFYELLAMMLANFNILVNGDNTTALSMFNKSLEILYYILYDITAGMFKVNFSLNKIASKKTLTVKDVLKTFNKNMKPGAIYKITSSKIICESLSYSGDNKFLKITSKITEQESSAGATRGKSKRVSIGEDKYFNTSMLESGSILYLSKSNPSPTNRINPFVNVDSTTGTITANPKFESLRENIDSLIKGKIMLT